MNGRCTADPLDHADDICEFCGDEFCRSCLIQTRGGKGQQICRDCAIRNSGIKGSKSNKPRPTKAQLERARKVLAEAKGTRNAKTFEFFDEAADYVPKHPIIEETPAQPEDSIDDDKPRGQKRRFALRRKGDDASSEELELDTPEETVDLDEALAPPRPTVPTGRSTPATTLIESGALSGPPSGAQPAATDVPMIPREPAADADFSSKPIAAGPSAGEEPDYADIEEAPSSLADRLRTRTTQVAPVASAFVPPVVHTAPAPVEDLPIVERLDADPFAIAEPSGVAAVPSGLDVVFPSSPQVHSPAATFDWQSTTTPADENLDDDPFGSGDPFGETAMVANTAAVASTPAPPPPPVQEPAVARRAADQFVTPTPGVPERRSEPAPTPAPEIRSRLATPAPQPAPSTPPAVVAPRPAAASGPTSAPPHAGHESPAGSADTDANGNWIPPLLRGMAPVAERRAAPLPKRRNSD